MMYVLANIDLAKLAKLLADYARNPNNKNPTSIEQLLVYLWNRKCRITYHQLRYRLEKLEVIGAVRRVQVPIVYTIGNRKFRIYKTLWFLNPNALLRVGR